MATKNQPELAATVKGVHRYQHPKTGRWYCYHRKTRQRVESEWLSRDFFQEVRELDAIANALKPKRPLPPKRPKVRVRRGITRETALERMYRRMAKDIRARATMRGLEAEITGEDLLAMHERQGGRCALSGLQFDMVGDDSQRLRPWAPSVDRIDCSKGYVKDNMRIVCIAANMMRGDWTEDVFFRLVRAIYRKTGRLMTHLG